MKENREYYCYGKMSTCDIHGQCDGCEHYNGEGGTYGVNLKDLFTEILDAKYTHLEETASFAFKRSGVELYIYFEESNGKTDWKNNFDFPAQPYREMEHRWFAHRGFLKVWKVIEPHLQAEICDLSVKRIVIGGYSHGAAIALLCHEYCKYNRPDIKVESYGFGCPRVLWGFVRKAVKKRFEGFTVIRNGTDIVTHVPPRILGYRHVGRLIEIGQDKDYKPVESHLPQSYQVELG